MIRSDIVRFLGAWLQAPLRVASVTPSSPSLSALITKHITPAMGPVLELGPGTGVFTYALLQRGIAERDITLVEYGREFIPLLRSRFPGAKLLQMNAADVGNPDHLEETVYGNVISGLPLLSMKPQIVMAILEGCFSRLTQTGAFYQFTYGPVCPVSPVLLGRLNLKAEKTGWTLRNLPPAAVYRISRTGLPTDWDKQ
ncbi:SAM-dependent methyltransferase (plasmid) [Phyllobacterium sp. 628]|uniref:class I SAM-dependent methyltransferase n=1 Tax=Phyllobacterium sp. 628 TaxID=2718938 RepID=UPI00166222D7|nr:SAM-dependent methyltransferase [Phyllobacterium sp. 628]QND55110.1 SAM-dependent methyltransferase [Phyllobacterium sp. 628]